MRKPLVFFGVSTAFGCLSTLVMYENKYIGAVLAASFLSIMFITNDKKIFYLIAGFFLIGTLSYRIYFNMDYPSGNTAEIRIEEKYGYSLVGNYKGRKLLLNGYLKGIAPGDIVTAEGEFIKDPEYSKGIIGELKISSVKNIKNGKLSFLNKIREEIHDKFKSRLGEERAGIIAAACFGDTSYLPADELNDYKTLGIIHVVSVSGLHMSLVYKIIERLGGVSAGIILSLFYVIFTGAKAPTLRAFIMIAVLKLAPKLYRKYDNLSSLSFSAVLLLVWKPYYISDLGFCLSYLSMLSVFLNYKQLNRFFYRLPKLLNEGVSMSLSAQFFSAPFAMTYFNTFSTGFMLGNIFLLPLYSIIVVLGNAAALFVKLDIIFSLFNYIILVFMYALEGGKILLLKICPPAVNTSYYYACTLAIVYISYILYRNGKRKYIYLPLFTIILFLAESYTIFPEVEYISDLGNYGVVIKYGRSSVLVMDKAISSQQIKQQLTARYNLDKIETLGEESSFCLSNGCSITLKSRNSKTNYPLNDIEINNKGKKVLITADKNLSCNVEYNNYDIMYVCENSTALKDSDKRRALPVILMVFNRIYIFS